MATTPKSGESSNIDMSKLISEMSKLSSPQFSSHPLPISFNISSLFPVPMDRTNYLSWKSQFEDVLEMHGLAAVVKNSTNPPKVQEDGSVHPELAKDKLVLSWIKVTSSSSIKTLLIPCTTAHQAWTMLAKRLSPFASTRVRILRDQIRTLKKDTNTTVTDYLNYAKSLFDSLTQAGATMDDDELISYVLDGLGLEYKELATTLHLHPDIDLDKFYDLALREEHLQKRMSLTAASGVAMAADRRSTRETLVQTPLVTIQLIPTVLGEDAGAAETGIKDTMDVDQGEQILGNQPKGIGFQIAVLSLTTSNILPLFLLLQLLLMDAFHFLQPHMEIPQIPNELMSYVLDVINHAT
ncbi:unnamed protein product [Prunus armeniaca]|uniref:Retrotransposon Copia-like N-terminal domain-containing protein n=1 Tax=Prunus armeniaca TaxID=36596 RepID=A0A6J5U8I8_PRUAR|nr:unnamed protein product [Prunus armeniaca]